MNDHKLGGAEGAHPTSGNENPDAPKDSAATPALLREFADALDKDRGHDKSMVTRTMRDAADEIARLYEKLRISYPATPVDCLLSDLIAIAEQSTDEAMYEDFVERLKQWRLEKEQFLAD